VILNLVSSQSMPAYFSDSLTSLRSLVVRNWDVDLEHATDCGQMTGNPEVIGSSAGLVPRNALVSTNEVRSGWSARTKPKTIQKRVRRDENAIGLSRNLLPRDSFERS
jgi:hypothetical protein